MKRIKARHCDSAVIYTHLTCTAVFILVGLLQLCHVMNRFAALHSMSSLCGSSHCPVSNVSKDESSTFCPQQFTNLKNPPI